MMYEMNHHNRYSHKYLPPVESQMQIQQLLKDPTFLASVAAADISAIENVLPPVLGKLDGKWVVDPA